MSAVGHQVRAREAWSKQRHVSEIRREIIRDSLDSMAGDLDDARKALTDLALGYRCVKVQQSPGVFTQPTREQTNELNSDPTLLPALLSQDLARVYAIPPDVAALKLLMGYVMGSIPTAQDAHLLADIEEAHRTQQFLAEVLHSYVNQDKYPEIAARLERLAEGGQG